jgi:REP element-mobilizing transposase RayT
MARLARRQSAPGALECGSVYHLANRGANRAFIFQEALDKIAFLSWLAYGCLKWGRILHCFCLMDNHFHLVVEDPRGTVSQFMHSLQSGFACSFNDTRAGGREGPVFNGRYRWRAVDARGYFDAVRAYVLHNPLRTRARAGRAGGGLPLVERPASDPDWTDREGVCGRVAGQAGRGGGRCGRPFRPAAGSPPGR